VLLFSKKGYADRKMIMRKAGLQLWPGRQSLNEEWIKQKIKLNIKINRATRIISMGSCFAREIKDWLKKNGYNYLEGETNKFPWVSHEVFTGDNGKSPTEHSSIAWERVYNVFTFEQILNYTFGDPEMDKRLFVFRKNGKKYVSDLMRTRILYRNEIEAATDIEDHIFESKRMFAEAELLILTLGMTEVWKSEKRNFVAPSNTGKYYSLPKDFFFQESDYSENLESLKRSCSILKKHNNKIKLIVTVSPVHLLATYRKNIDVISASCASKSILRAVANEITKEKDVFYFPSYEIATIVAPILGMIVYPDNHHVSREVVEIIMNTFSEIIK
jgi:hypothetical protein